MAEGDIGVLRIVVPWGKKKGRIRELVMLFMADKFFVDV